MSRKGIQDRASESAGVLPNDRMQVTAGGLGVAGQSLRACACRT